MRNPVKIAILMGGNLGNVPDFFDFAVEKLRDGGVGSVRRSSIFRSAAVDCVPGTPEFQNAALTGVWRGTAVELLRLCRKIEREAGRPAVHSSRESRTLDLDLILFGDEAIASPELTVPHPRARRRRFVLEPLAGIAPEWRFPDTGETVAEALARLEETEAQL